MSMARVQARGQVTIPHDIREACGVAPGTDLMFVKTGPTTFECWVLPPPLSLREIFDKYSVEGVAPDIEQLLEEMGDDLAREYSLDQASAKSGTES